MKIYRIGGKVISGEKVVRAIDEILEIRVAGATQEEAAASAGVPRTFVSYLETLGSVRKGAKIAFIAFPVSNKEAAAALAEKYGIELILVFSQSEREQVEGSSAATLFNSMLDTLAALKSFDTAVVAASDYRIGTFHDVLDCEVIGVELGQTPLTEDVEVNLVELEEIFKALLSKEPPQDTTRRVFSEGSAALSIAKRWLSLKK